VKHAIVVAGLIAAALTATLVRYRSLDPCTWLVHDATQQSELPALAVAARIRAGFLMRGIAEPGAYDCLNEWWHQRSANPPPVR
jgi:hypothetical protein